MLQPSRILFMVLLLSALAFPAAGANSCATQNSTAPVAVNDYVDWPAGPIAIPVLQNDYDPDGQPLKILSVSSPGAAGQTQISADQKSILFTPAAGYKSAQFSYSIADQSGESCSTPGWVYMREPGPTGTFTWDCNGFDCAFRASMSTNEWLKDFTWRFICPSGAPECSYVKPRWPSGILATLAVEGVWRVQMEAYYYTGKVALYEAAVLVRPAPQYLKFRRFNSSEDGLYVDLVMTETSAEIFDVAEAKIFWGDGTDSGFSHVSGLVSSHLTHSYSDPGLYKVQSYLRKSTGEDGFWTADQIVVNAPPVVRFTLAPDPANPNIIKKDITGTYDDADVEHRTIIPSWQWDMGDGSSRTHAYPNVDPYTYTKPGTFLVTLKLTDKHGASALATHQVTIPNKPPSGKFRVECTDLKCDLVAYDLVDELGVKTFTWNVGGQIITTTTPTYTHTFAAAGKYPITLTLSDGEKTADVKRVAEVRAARANEKLALYMIAPCRAYDAGADVLTAGTTRVVSLASCIPADAVAAEVNAVVVAPPAPGNLTLWSSADAQPVTSNLNFPAGSTRSNNGAVRVASRTVNARLSMAAGTSARFIVDVVGYYAPERTAGSGETGPLEWSPDTSQKRLYNSTQTGVKLTANNPTFASLGSVIVPQAVFANVAMVGSTAPGHLKMWAAGTSEPSQASVLNYDANINIANGVLTRVAPGAVANNTMLKYMPANAGATSDYILDLYAQYRTTTEDGARYEAIAPCRLLDTRDPAYGEPRLTAGEIRAFYAPGNCGIPTDLWWGGALRVNLTVITPSGSGHLQTIPEYSTPESLATSIMNFTSGITIANGAVVTVNPSRHFQVKATAGADLVVDVVGYYRTAPNFYVFDYGLTQSFKMSYNWGADMRSQWDYGDGTVGVVDPSRTRCRTFENPGTYSVKLIAWNIKDPNTKTVYERSVVVANKAPHALLNGGQEGKYITANGYYSTDEPPPGESIPPVGWGCGPVATYTALTYTYDWGDGTPFGSGVETEHTYVKPGTYKMTLTATDRFGAQDTSEGDVVIPNDPPTASFIFYCNGLDCEFDASGSTDDGGITSYQWNFGVVNVAPNITTVPKTTYHFSTAGKYVVSLTTNDGSLGSAAAKRTVIVTGTPPTEKLSFFPIAPCRVYDSRTGTALPGNAVTDVAIASVPKCGVPATAKAAALNLVALQPTSAGYLTVWSGSGTDPVTAAVVFPAGVNRATQANVALSPTGTIAVKPGLSGASPSTHLVVDVYGYYAADASAAPIARGPYKYRPIAPCRVYDSRPSAPLAGGETRYIQVDRTLCGMAATDSALAANLHIIGSVTGAHTTLFSSALTAPAEASTLNVGAGGTITNGALSELGGRPSDDLGVKYVAGSSTSTTHIALDAVGTFAAGNTLSYQAITPCRILDTRVADYGVGRLPAGITTPVQIQGNCGVPRGARAIAVHATVVSPDGDGYLRLDRPDRPLLTHTSVLFKATDPSISNAVIVELSDQPRDLGITPSIFGGAGLHLVLDVVGFFKE